MSDLFSGRDASPAPTSNRSESLPPSPRQPKSVYSSRIDGIVARLVEQKRREGTSSKTLSQLKQVISVFQDITGVQDITRLEQQHVAHLPPFTPQYATISTRNAASPAGTFSSETAPSLSPSGANSARHERQPSCPW